MRGTATASHPFRPARSIKNSKKIRGRDFAQTLRLRQIGSQFLASICLRFRRKALSIVPSETADPQAGRYRRGGFAESTLVLLFTGLIELAPAGGVLDT